MNLSTSWDILRLVHCAAVIFMAGAICIVHWVEYPLFAFVAPDRFIEFHALHCRRIGYIVGPAMVLELATAFLLLYLRRDALTATLGAASATCFVLTFALAMPLHDALSRGFDPLVMVKLMTVNAWRVAVWGLHLLLLPAVLGLADPL